MLVGKKYHLTYCANVHAGESWGEAFQQLQRHIPEIKKTVCHNQQFGVGLYLSDRASKEIIAGDALKKFKDWLNKNDYYVFTINGFPFGGFHQKVVKDIVYKPDWSSQERLDYTKRLFNILSALLPEGTDGGISTSPVSYKYWFNDESEKQKVLRDSCTHLAEIALYLNGLSSVHGKNFHLDIEPEPDCFIENSDEVVEFFNQHLIPAGVEMLAERKISVKRAEEIIRTHINVCYDICHFAVEFEEHEKAIEKILSAEIKIGKVQISSAVRANLSEDNRTKVLNQLEQFDEPRYFHQTVKRKKSGELKRFRDLPFALENDELDDAELRTHFHIPVFQGKYAYLDSTQEDILRVFRVLKNKNLTPHLEVETYTWDVLPKDMKIDLGSSIVRELEWVIRNLYS